MDKTHMTINVENPEHRGAVIEDLYVSVNHVADLPRGQATVDGIIDRVTSVPDAGPFKFLNDFYTANQATIQSTAMALSANIDNKTIESAINTFGETTKIVLKGLDNLEKLHPFIGAAVLAFKLVVTLDLTRRENNRKVIALKIEMQSMISVLFQLRHIRDPEDKGPDGTPLKERLGGLIEKIAKDIRECGSACDVYMKKGFLAKTIKSKKYESRLAAYGSLFEDDRTALERSLTVHTAIGVENANLKLDSQAEHLKSIEEKLDMMLIFKKLNTPRELEVQKFLDDNGGAKACIEKDDLLSKLISKSGETVANISDHTARGDQDLVAARKALTKELAEDMDEVMKKNFSLFEKKLDMQNRHLEDALRQQSTSIINAIFSGAHERIHDIDLQNIWKEMSWKGSVKARHFVLALHDYFIDKDLNMNREIEGMPPVSPLASPQITGYATPNAMPLGSPQDDKWALAYVNVAHVQPILEAVDDDGTGFVSIKEVNTFANSRPRGWTLLHWLAFWAEGWHTSISTYKSKIYVLLRKMFSSAGSVLPSNRRIFDEFLDHYAFSRIELLLRSTKDAGDAAQLDSELARVTELYTDAEQERLAANLASVGYDLDTSSTVALVTGPGRIERYIFPLLYLLIKHQLKWFTLGCTHVLNYEEVVGHTRTLMSVFAAMDERIQVLEAVLKQTHTDVQSRLKHIAFGMFELSFGDISLDVSQNSIITWSNHIDEYSPESAIHVPTWDVDLEILKYPTVDFFFTDAYDFDPPTTTELTEEQNPLEGTWAGHCFRSNQDKQVSYEGLLQFTIESVSDNSSGEGKGHSYDGTFDVSAAINETEETGETEVILDLNFEDGYIVQCTGKFDAKTQTITGSWSLEGNVTAYDSDAGDVAGEAEDSDSDSESNEDENEDENENENEENENENEDGTENENENEDENENEGGNEGEAEAEAGSQGGEVEGNPEAEGAEAENGEAVEEVATEGGVDLAGEISAETGPGTSAQEAETQSVVDHEDEDSEYESAIGAHTPALEAGADTQGSTGGSIEVNGEAETAGGVGDAELTTTEAAPHDGENAVNADDAVVPAADEVAGDDGEAANGEDGADGEEAADGEEVEDDEAQSQAEAVSEVNRNTFVFTRTPADLQRSRYDAAEFAKNPARARWSFACKAVLRDVQRRSWSWPYLRSKIVERKRYIELAGRRFLQQYAPIIKLLPEEKEELLLLRRNSLPSEGRLCEAFVIFNAQRIVWHMGVTCDGCARELLRTRLTCVTCQTPTYTDSMDLCGDCKDIKMARDEFDHDATHTLMKVENVLQDPDHAWVIPEALRMIPRVKASFRAMEAATAKAAVGTTATKRRKFKPLLCACCLKAVSTPCWVCISCAPDTYVCMDCDSKRLPPHPEGAMAFSHTLEHALFLLKDSTDVVAPEPVNPDVVMGNKITDLENKVEQRLGALESSVDKRFSDLEALLRQIAGALHIPAPIPVAEINESAPNEELSGGEVGVSLLVSTNGN